jgi:hypothetical protein
MNLSLHDEETIELAVRLRQMAVGTAEEQASVKDLCKDDPVAFLMAAGWTKVVKEVAADGHERPSETTSQPFIPWRSQRQILRDVADCIKNGEDIAWAKSREMGASWLMLSLSLWGWLYHEWSVLICSRTEDLVDRAGDLDALFPKIDSMIERLPSCMLPCPRADLLPSGKHRRHMVLAHPNGHSIVGQSTTEHIGRGGRRTCVIFDEAAAQEKLESAWRSAADTTSCRIAVSTHLTGSYFTRSIWAKAQDLGNPKPMLTTYVGHPAKSQGGEWRTDVDGTVTGEPARRYFWSPWFERQTKRRDMVDIRENVLALPSTAGKGFFPLANIVRCRREITPPRRCDVYKGRLIDAPNGKWRIFREPDETNKLVIAADPAYGTGRNNSAAVMMDVERRSVVATYVDPHCSPYELAQIMAEAGRTWARGRAQLLIGWEVNGAGAAIHKDLHRLHYPAIWKSKRGRYGWLSTRQSKRELYGGLARAIADATVVIPDSEILDEMETTIVYDNGGIGPARLEVDRSSGAAEAHGDRVVAMALAVLMCETASGASDRVEPETGLPDFSAKSILNMEEILDL